MDYQLPLFNFYDGINQVVCDIEYQLKLLFENGIPQWTDTQDRDLDNRLSPIVSRKGNNAIDTVEKLYLFIDEKTLELKDLYAPPKIISAAIHKFLNFQSERAFNLLFCQHENVIKEQNYRNKNVDFRILKPEIFPVDLKVTRWPKTINKNYLTIGEALNNKSGKGKLIDWLYKKQGYNRWNWQNRIFIVCIDKKTGNHLVQKSNILNMRPVIFNYLDEFDKDNLYQVSQQKILGKIITENEIAFSDIIWNF